MLVILFFPFYLLIGLILYAIYGLYLLKKDEKLQDYDLYIIPFWPLYILFVIC
jgi:hypothetical protein